MHAVWKKGADVTHTKLKVLWPSPTSTPNSLSSYT
jgi:hypothetical protein